MAYGSPFVARWGSSQWGVVLPENGALVSLDGNTRGTLERLIYLDGLAGLFGQELQASFDGLASGDLEVACALDFAPIPAPDAVFRALDAAPYLLVEMQLPAATIRVAAKTRNVFGEMWIPRLVGTSDILRTIGRGTDDLQLVIDDTDFDGQVRFRDVFSADDPEGSPVKVFLGAEGLIDSEHQEVFDGKIEGVTGFSHKEVRIQVVRRESVEDKLIGVLVDQSGFPLAPPESLGSMIPHVFGTVENSEGIVIDTNAIGTLDVNHTAQDGFIQLTDASPFPPGPARIRVEEELIDYFGKTGNVLSPVARGVGGTTAADHSKGIEVAEDGDFVVKFANHPVSKIENVRLLLPTSNLGEPVPPPVSFDLINATATWDRLPEIRDPDARPVYQRVHFKDPDAGLNTATDPQFAARENKGYEAFRVARFLPGEVLALTTNVENLGEPGDILQVWIGTIFDPKALQDINARVVVDGVAFALQPTDIVPDEIARNDEKTGDRFYDIPPPSINIPAPPAQAFAVTPEVVCHPGIWAFQSNAKRVVDKDEDTCAAFMFISVTEAAIVGTADAIFKLPAGQSVAQATGGAAGGPGPQAGGMISDAALVFVAGWELTPFSSTFDVFLRKDGTEIPGTRFKACTPAPSGFCAGLIRGKETFRHSISADIAAMIDENVEWVVHPALGVSNGLWVGCELFLEGTFTPPEPEINVVQDARNSVTNYFEVTDRLGTQASPGGTVVPDWGWFSDPNRGGVVQFTGFGTFQDEARIIETFYVVRYLPFVSANTQVPRTFADVAGIEPTGDPVEISRRIVTLLPPLGLGLDPTTRIDAASYFETQQSLQADGIRSDFTLRRQTSALELLSELAAQTDIRETWEAGKHRVVRRPRADTSLTTLLNLTQFDQFQNKRPVLKRSTMRSVKNRFVTKWKVYGPTGEPSRTENVDNLTSQANPNFGVQEQVLELRLISDDSTATLVAARKAERMGAPRWLMEFDVPIYLLSLRRGDLVTLTSKAFSFEVGEITQINLASRGLKRLSLQIAVWKQ